MNKKKRVSRLSPGAKLLVSAKFKKASTTLGGYEREIQLPTGSLRINLGTETVEHIKNVDHAIQAVAALAFKGGRESRDSELAAIRRERDDLRRERDTQVGKFSALKDIFGRVGDDYYY